VIYCVVPSELGEDTFRRLVEHYQDNPNVSVIVERRSSERRNADSGSVGRTIRDRRHHAPGSSAV
jgi:hypothetical protein